MMSSKKVGWIDNWKGQEDEHILWTGAEYLLGQAVFRQNYESRISEWLYRNSNYSTVRPSDLYGS